MGELLALDLEATCLRPGCRVVAAAVLPIRGRSVDLGGADCGYEPAGRGAELVHGLAGGGGLPGCSRGLDRVLARALSAGTLVVYGLHDVELLLGEAEARGLPAPPRLCYVDLLALLLRNPARLHEARARGGLPLDEAVKELLGLEPPPRRFHHPLDDALYAALLYLALSAAGEPRPACRPAARRRSLLSRIARLLGR